MATAKQKRAQARMKRAAKKCKGRRAKGFRSCVRRELKGKKG